MKSGLGGQCLCDQPKFIECAKELAEYIRTLTLGEVEDSMHVSSVLARKVQDLYLDWNTSVRCQTPAVDSFIGDIYSGLRANEFNLSEREYAQNVLRILSGLYGILSPNDGVCPYRLEMGYKFPAEKYSNLYSFWGRRIADVLPKTGSIVNLAAEEYSKVITPFISNERIVTPKFLSYDSKKQKPVFIAVHAKIARGAFARWLICSRIQNMSRLCEFSDLGYEYSSDLSTPKIPTFVCKEFGGKGLSIRLK